MADFRAELTALVDILAKADAIAEQSFYGSLCPVIVLAGEQEIRRVGPMVHHQRNQGKRWDEGKAKWRAAVEQDADVMRLLGVSPSWWQPLPEHPQLPEVDHG